MVSIQNVVDADFDAIHRDKTTVPVPPHNMRSQRSKEIFQINLTQIKIQ